MRGLQVVVDHELPARDVDHAHAVLHLREGVRVQPALGLGRDRQVDRDEVGGRVEVVGRLRPLHSGLAEALLADVEVERHDAHAERERALGYELADAAEPDHAECLLVQLGARVLRPVPCTADECGVRLRDVPREREQHPHGVLGGGDHIRLRRVRDDDAALGRRVHVDVVHSDAGPADRAEAVRLRDQVRVELRRRPDEHAVELADPALELAVLPVDAELDVEAGVAQQLDAAVADLLLDEYARTGGARLRLAHAATGTPASRNTRCAAETPVPSSTSAPSSFSVISSAAIVVTMSNAP